MIETIYKEWSTNRLPQPDAAFIDSFNRYRLTEELAKILRSTLVLDQVL